MKNHVFPTLVLGILLSLNPNRASAQESPCVQCNGTSASGVYASAIGNGTTASGNHSFAGGYLSTSSGSNSFSFGYNATASQSTSIALGNTSQATGVGSIAIGTYTKATAKNAIAIGAGTTASYPLTNSVANSIALGVNSNKPTLLITKATNNNYTGKVAIGPVTSPTAKLHLKSDNNEDAGVFLEPGNKTSYKAFIKLYDANHLVSVDKTGTLSLSAGTGNIGFSGEHYCFGGSNEKKLRMYSGERATLYHNAKRNTNGEIRDDQGTSCAIEFNNDGFLFRTAVNQPTRGNEITNWKDVLLLDTDGKVGIGSASTYLENVQDNLILHSPSKMDLQSNLLTLTGKVGINTLNQVDDYALAVNGGIISTKVFIKEVNQWPDYVFADKYELLSLYALKAYLQEHHHLPGIPSEAEVVRQGYDVHEMQAALLEKIEELTRYILILQEEIDSLKDEQGKTWNVQFDYDENGNRILRTLLFKKEPLSNTPLEAQPVPHYDLFPNPTPGQFSLVIRDKAEKYPLHALLMTETGRVIEEHDIAGSRTDFDLSGHASGLYLLEVTGPEGTETWKVIKR